MDPAGPKKSSKQTIGMRIFFGKFGEKTGEVGGL